MCRFRKILQPITYRSTFCRDPVSVRSGWIVVLGRCQLYACIRSPETRRSAVFDILTNSDLQAAQTCDGGSRPQLPAMLFVVPTIGFNLLYVLVIIRLAQRELVWLNVTGHPTAEWIAQQITEAFPWTEAPRYLIRDRDAIYGAAVTRRLRAMGIRDKPIAPGRPWQNSFAERLIGSIRRECVDHVIALGEQHLRRVLKSYASYYNTARTHRSLDKDAPISRPVQRIGRIVSHALVGGLHHQYARI